MKTMQELILEHAEQVKTKGIGTSIGLDLLELKHKTSNYGVANCYVEALKQINAQAADLAAVTRERDALRVALAEIRRETIMPDGSRLSDEVARIMRERDEARATAFREAAQIAREHDENDEFTIICNMIAEACERAALAAKE